jgi:Bacteriophage head to tail connecting protein
MFSLRYDADSGFVPATQTAIRRCIAFGNSFVYVDESFNKKSVFSYQHMPLDECYIATDSNDMMDTWYRYYTLTARQAVATFGDGLTPRITEAAKSSSDMDKPFTFAHCIHPRSDYTDASGPHAYQTTHVDVEHRTVVRRAGFYEMPVIDFRWLPDGGVYGEGPVMRVLAEIQSAQLLAKNELVASEQSVKPALLVANAGVLNRPNTNANSIILGGLNQNGDAMVKPLMQGQRLDFANMVLQAKQSAIKESLYINLFQLLIQNPQMSATEAMIRANEKAELLGPAGSRFQGGFSRMIAREHGILVRRGLYDQDSVYAVPQSAQGREMPSVQHTSPLDRLRRAKEGEGIARLLEMIAPLAQIDAGVMDNIDPDTTIREMRDILGAPVGILRDPEAVAAIRKNRADQQAQAQNAAIAEQLASASKQGSQALAGAKQAGAL